MRDINDTISAVSSASLAGGSVSKSIIRISGPGAFDIIYPLNERLRTFLSGTGKRFLTPFIFEVNESLSVEGNAYCFRSPYSYAGQDLVELHFFASECVFETVLAKVFKKTRLAEAGEFTLRAYLNGKIDLSQAEAVAAIVSGSNSFQLAAAERLLDGNLCENIASIREKLLEVISAIEAGMDFGEEDIEIISEKQACDEITSIICKLESLLNGSVRYEEMIDMVSVGIAGAANVGKEQPA